MRRWLFSLTFFVAAALAARAAGAEGSALAGTWRLLPERSTELSPWRSLQLVITVGGPRVVLTRKLAWSRRTVEDVTALDLTKDVNVVPVSIWPDNRHLGAYIGGDGNKRVQAWWLEDGRLLRTSADLVLATQQGARDVNILTDYRVSANGQQLTLIELRSTRSRPIVYVLARVDP